MEMSLTPTLQLIVHKGAGRKMKWPRAEDAANHYPMGMDADLDAAMKNAIQHAVDFLKERAGLSAAEAYALCTLSVDFRVGEAVNIVKMVYGVIPKKLFRDNPDYWTKQLNWSRSPSPEDAVNENAHRRFCRGNALLPPEPQRRSFLRRACGSWCHLRPAGRSTSSRALWDRR